MQINVNGQARVIGAITVTALLEELALSQKRLAVEINGELVPRSQHEQYLLKENDNVEIVHAIGGG